MARAANTYSATAGAVNQSAHTQAYTTRRYISSTEGDISCHHHIRLNTFSPPTSIYDQVVHIFGATTDWENASHSALTCDDLYYYRCYGNFVSAGLGTFDRYGITKSFRTDAVDPTVGLPSVGAQTSTSITVNGSFTPATKDSTAYCYIEYKLSSEPTVWTQWSGTYVDSGTGYSSNAIPQTVVTGLSPATQYNFRFRVYRPDTANSTKTYYGNPNTLTTLDNTPEVTTDSATSVSTNTATLNATVDHNSTDGNLSWRYIATGSYSAPPDDAQGTEVSYGDNPITGDGSGSKGISGLTASTGYTFWAIYDPTGAGSTVFGAADAFTTAGDPAAEALDEDLMITQYVDAQYGVATTLTFTLREFAASSSDSFYTGTAPVAADITLVQDGTVSPGGISGTPAQVASVPQLYSLTLTATEMQAEVNDIIISDAAGSAFRDQHIQVRTQKNLGTLVVNGASKATNTDAVDLTGNGTGAGLKAVAGDSDGQDIEGVLGSNVNNYGTIAAYDSTTVVDLDNSTAEGSADDYYNGALILFHGGTGAGQCRVITDYDASEYRATISPPLEAVVSTDTLYIIVPGEDMWGTSPGAELDSLPDFTAGYGDMLQFVFERMYNNRNQTALEFTLRNGSDDGDLAVAGVDDDGALQTHEQMSND